MGITESLDFGGRAPERAEGEAQHKNRTENKKKKKKKRVGRMRTIEGNKLGFK
jgi:hypothetical protein